MIELINTLNNTSANRTFFYVCAILIALSIIVNGVVALVKHIRK